MSRAGESRGQGREDQKGPSRDKGTPKGQRPVVFQLKLQNLSREKERDLRRAFLEAKWLYNWLVSDTQRLHLPANKVQEVEVKVRDGFENRELLLLGSQVKQEIADRLRDNLKALARLKEKGHKVGGLRYRPFVNSIPLKQYGMTHTLDRSRNRVRIQKLGTFRVLGLHQIPPEAEIANAVLVQKPSGYYLHVTCYLPKESFPRQIIGEAIAIDLGVHAKLTLSNGVKIDFELRETERLKALQRKLAKTKKGSTNRRKLRFLLRREHEKIARRRRDVHNKVLAFLKGYKEVVFQEDFVKGWASLFGGQVHSSGVGGLKARLRTASRRRSPWRGTSPPPRSASPAGDFTSSLLGTGSLSASAAGSATETRTPPWSS
jgi:putative transposase